MWKSSVILVASMQFLPRAFAEAPRSPKVNAGTKPKAPAWKQIDLMNASVLWHQCMSKEIPLDEMLKLRSIYPQSYDEFKRREVLDQLAKD